MSFSSENTKMYWMLIVFLIGGEILEMFQSVIFATITAVYCDCDISTINPNMCISIEGYMFYFYFGVFELHRFKPKKNLIVLIIRNAMDLLFVGVWTSKKLLRTKFPGMEHSL
jgi:hypothetical protein